MSQNSLLTPKNNELEIIEFLIEESLPDGSTYVGSYGINVAKVLEIIRMPAVTSMPNASHPSSLGTFNLRGKVLPLVDLGAWLGKTLVKNPTNKVLVTEFCGVQAAFLVSAVTSIHRLTWDQIEPPNHHVQSYSQSSITGVLRINERVLFILDMEKILADFAKYPDASTIYGIVYPLEPGIKHKLSLLGYNIVSRIGYWTGTIYMTLGCNTAFRKDLFVGAGMYITADAGDDFEIARRMKKYGRVRLDTNLKVGFSMRRYIEFGAIKSIYQWLYIVAHGGSSEKYQYAGKEYGKK